MTEEQEQSWFQYRAKCNICKYDDLESNFPTHRFSVSRPNTMICPKCRTIWIETLSENGLKGKKSSMSSYAVHFLCGKWHKEGTSCKEDK